MRCVIFNFLMISVRPFVVTSVYLSWVFLGGLFVVFVMLRQNIRTAFHCLEPFGFSVFFFFLRIELKTCVTPVKSVHMNPQQFDIQVLADVFQMKEVAT